MKKKRKIIQIAMAAYEGMGIVVLCDDGSLWHWYQGKWEPINDLPQD